MQLHCYARRWPSNDRRYECVIIKPLIKLICLNADSFMNETMKLSLSTTLQDSVDERCITWVTLMFHVNSINSMHFHASNRLFNNRLKSKWVCLTTEDDAELHDYILNEFAIALHFFYHTILPNSFFLCVCSVALASFLTTSFSAEIAALLVSIYHPLIVIKTESFHVNIVVSP